MASTMTLIASLGTVCIGTNRNRTCVTGLAHVGVQACRVMNDIHLLGVLSRDE